MTIHKLKKHQDDIPYTMASRDIVQQLTNPVALAIWIYLQSKPEDWNLSEGQIRSHFNVGEDRYKAAMRQLREAGLYEVVRIKNDMGKFIGCYYHVYGKPQGWKTTRVEMAPYIKEKSNTKEEENKTQGDISFSDFYNLYDKKVRGKEAERKWKRMTLKSKRLAMLHVPILVSSTPDKQYRPAPVVYLNREGWNDETGGTEDNYNVGYI